MAFCFQARVCVCTCVCLCTCVCVYKCVYLFVSLWESEWVSSSITLYPIESVTELEACHFVCWLGRERSGSSACPNTGLQAGKALPHFFYVSTRDLNSGTNAHWAISSDSRNWILILFFIQRADNQGRWWINVIDICLIPNPQRADIYIYVYRYLYMFISVYLSAGWRPHMYLEKGVAVSHSGARLSPLVRRSAISLRLLMSVFLSLSPVPPFCHCLGLGTWNDEPC